MIPTWEESLLISAEVAVEWLGVRDWAPGAVLRDWTTGTGAACLYLVEKGTLEVVVQGVSWQLKAGEAPFIVPGTSRELLSTPGGACWYSLGMTIRGRGRMDLAHLLGNTRQWSPPPVLALWLRMMAEAWTEHTDHPLVQNHLPADAAAIIVANGFAKAALGACWKTLPGTQPARTSDTIPRWLTDTLQRIHDKPHCTLAELADSAAVSAATLRRGFHRYLHQSPQQYLVEQRLLLAKNDLETSEESVLVIAGRVGFESLSHFTRLFAERFGETPARYRRHCRTEKV